MFSDYTKAYVYRLLKEEEEKIQCFARGVYFLPKKTFLGESTITPNMIANKKYITNGEATYGIYSGIGLLNTFGITSQVPNTLEIIANNEATRKRTVNICGSKYILRKSRFPISNDNYNYYSLLQLFYEMPNDFNLNEFSKKMILDFSKENKIKAKTLIEYSLYFPNQTLKNIVKSGVFNGIV